MPATGDPKSVDKSRKKRVGKSNSKRNEAALVADAHDEVIANMVLEKEDLLLVLDCLNVNRMGLSHKDLTNLTEKEEGHRLDLNKITDKITSEAYSSAKQFVSDYLEIYESCRKSNAFNSLANQALVNVNFVRKDLVQANKCVDCVTIYYTRESDFFTLVCRQPHTIVWAQIAGSPYWPAKVMSVYQQEKEVEVKFFGPDHESARLPFSCCNYLASSNLKSKTNFIGFNASIVELKQHIVRLNVIGIPDSAIFAEHENKRFDGRAFICKQIASLSNGSNKGEDGESLDEDEHEEDLEVQTYFSGEELSRLVQDPKFQPKLMVQPIQLEFSEDGKDIIFDAEKHGTKDRRKRKEEQKRRLQKLSKAAEDKKKMDKVKEKTPNSESAAKRDAKRKTSSTLEKTNGTKKVRRRSVSPTEATPKRLSPTLQSLDSHQVPESPSTEKPMTEVKQKTSLKQHVGNSDVDNTSINVNQHKSSQINSSNESMRVQEVNLNSGQETSRTEEAPPTGYPEQRKRKSSESSSIKLTEFDFLAPGSSPSKCKTMRGPEPRKITSSHDSLPSLVPQNKASPESQVQGAVNEPVFQRIKDKEVKRQQNFKSVHLNRPKSRSPEKSLSHHSKESIVSRPSIKFGYDKRPKSFNVEVRMKTSVIERQPTRHGLKEIPNKSSHADKAKEREVTTKRSTILGEPIRHGRKETPNKTSPGEKAKSRAMIELEKLVNEKRLMEQVLTKQRTRFKLELEKVRAAQQEKEMQVKRDIAEKRKGFSKRMEERLQHREATFFEELKRKQWCTLCLKEAFREWSCCSSGYCSSSCRDRDSGSHRKSCTKK